MLRRPAALAFVVLALAGCSALKSALTSHVDVAAKAGSQELSSMQLAEMMTAANMPPRKDLANAVANLWVNYHLLAQAAARLDTMADPKVADEAMWAQIAQRRLQKLQAEKQKEFGAPDAAATRKAYDDGAILAARHILILADSTPAKIASARRTAERVRAQTTPANFVAMVKKHSGDPGSKDAGGEYFFPPPQMVPEFDKATRALKPGEISGLVQTPYGFHIILRETYEEAKVKFDSMYQGVARQKAESIWIAGLDASQKVTVKDGAAKTVKAIAEDVDAYRNDRTVLATSKSVDLRASRAAGWIASFPAQMRIRQQLQQVPDSQVPDFVRNLMRNELLLKAADSAKVTLDATEMDQIRAAFRGSVQNSMGGLGILPSQLADSAKSNADREKVAVGRISTYMAKLLKNETQFVDVAEPVSLALRKKFDAKVIAAGIDRAVTQAEELKVKADSIASATMPQSAVPMPGASGASKQAPDAAIRRMLDSAMKAEDAKAAKAKGAKQP